MNSGLANHADATSLAGTRFTKGWALRIKSDPRASALSRVEAVHSDGSLFRENSVVRIPTKKIAHSELMRIPTKKIAHSELSAIKSGAAATAIGSESAGTCSII